MITLSPNVHKNLEESWGFDRNKHEIHPIDFLNSRQYPISDYSRKEYVICSFPFTFQQDLFPLNWIWKYSA